MSPHLSRSFTASCPPSLVPRRTGPPPSFLRLTWSTRPHPHSLGGTTRIACPVLFIQATRDNVLLPSMSAGMERHIPRLTRRDVPAGHWALWQTAREVNAHLADWLRDVVFAPAQKL